MQVPFKRVLGVRHHHHHRSALLRMRYLLHRSPSPTLRPLHGVNSVSVPARLSLRMLRKSMPRRSGEPVSPHSVLPARS